ncbi:hypothetical protein [Brevundimonas sp.]|uniref:hypothetical protein n=1 Tax=Brevundimonas sp. TaxID=1871086 RepID=UPI0028A6ECF5|nr:hypothetical protein [Brevundimonas sp.]
MIGVSASPLLHAAAIPSVKTYAEFQAYIAAQATGGLVSWSAISLSTGAYRLVSPTAAQAPNLGNGLMGTPWGPASANGYDRANSWVFAAAGHGFPSAAVKTAQMAGSLEIFIELAELTGSASVISLDRNGILSSANAGSAYRTAMTRLDYFDPVLGPMTMNPSTGSGPLALTW